jgi:hypothetical protein
MDDSTLLAEELGKIEQENKDLKAKNKILQLDIDRHIRNGKISLGLYFLTITLPLLVVTITLCWFFWKVIQAPDVASHCIIEQTSNQPDLHLKGIVEWGVDFDYGVIPSFEEGVKRAKMIGCPLVSNVEK